MANARESRTFDEQMADMLREAQESGELRAAPSWGKPLDLGDGYFETPPELRMAFKVLKDAGCVPPEVQLFNDLARLREELAALDPEGEGATELRRRIGLLEAEISLRVERLARRA
jgi:hypothetical protein